MGLEVEIVENGRIAVDKLLQQQQTHGAGYDIVLMDMQMPELDGYGAVRELWAAGYTVVLIALTAYAMASDRDRCLEVGCDDYASKPIDKERLFDVIATHLDSQGLAA